MEQIEIRFPDGTARLYPKGTLVRDLLPGKKGNDESVAAKLDGKLLDLQTPMEQGGEL